MNKEEKGYDPYNLLDESYYKLTKLIEAVESITCDYDTALAIGLLVSPAIDEAKTMLSRVHYNQPPHCTGCGSTEVNHLTSYCDKCDCND